MQSLLGSLALHVHAVQVIQSSQKESDDKQLFASASYISRLLLRSCVEHLLEKKGTDLIIFI